MEILFFILFLQAERRMDTCRTLEELKIAKFIVLNLYCMNMSCGWLSFLLGKCIAGNLSGLSTILGFDKGCWYFQEGYGIPNNWKTLSWGPHRKVGCIEENVCAGKVGVLASSLGTYPVGGMLAFKANIQEGGGTFAETVTPFQSLFFSDLQRLLEIGPDCTIFVKSWISKVQN